MIKNIIDLHMHSGYSDDGEFKPSVLVQMCKDAGLKYIAVADHNSVKGVEEAVNKGEELGVKVITAIEIDCTYEGVNLHVLGYYIDYNLKEFGELEENILEQEKKASPERLRLVEETGIYVNRDKLSKIAKNGIIIGEDIAEASVYEPENKDNPLIKPYLEGGSRSDNPYVNFYWDICAQGKPAYVPVHFISLKEAVDLINKAGGIPILAHPGNNIHEDKKLLDGILDSGVKGMEVYSSYHSSEQIEFYRNEAESRNCLMSCGSDFHGKIKPAIELGGCRCDGNTEKKIIENFILNIKK